MISGMPRGNQERWLLLCLVLSGAMHSLQHCNAWTVNRFGSCRRVRPTVLSASSSWLENINGPPYLAVITEPNTCDSEERMNTTLEAIEAAVSTQQVALVSVRIGKPADISQEDIDSRVKDLTRRILDLKDKNNFHVVVSSDWVGTVDASSKVGIHVKESHRGQIPDIRDRLGNDVLIGTSAHSIESALDAVSKYGPNYLFVGTCYETASHPEKKEADLEGPALPGQVSRAIQTEFGTSPVVLAIGGIDETNCWEPVLNFGADGVAVIRAVLQASNPADAVLQIQANMHRGNRK